MIVIDATNKRPYGSPGGLSPQSFGQRLAPVHPGPDGHFDHVDPDSREFSSATMYATVRRTLDIWQDYFGHKIQWFFHPTFTKLLLIPVLEWDNAQSGFGFLEFGFGRTPTGAIDPSSPFCQNFDVLAHEVGHNILFAELGFPDDGSETAEFGGHHEGGADLVAAVSVLHFDSVVDYLLENSKGNLFSVNELSRIGELASGGQIRNLFNYFKMSDVDEEPHSLSQPLTGAIFDIFVDVFQKELVKRGLITQQLADRSTNGRSPENQIPGIDQEFAAAYAGHADGFKAALLAARDYLGRLLAETWSNISPSNLTYTKILRAILEADEVVSGGVNQTNIRECFDWREIFHEPSAAEMKIRRISDCGFVGHSYMNGHHPALTAQRQETLAAAPQVYIEGRVPVAVAKRKRKR
ncbi:hypothetical protein BH10PLA2_BH10PLA2_10660 [soil metagenome]